MRRARGFTLPEVMLALVVLTIGFAAALRVWLGLTDAVATGRRWSAMSAAAGAEVARLERDYLAAAPACVPPAAGSRFAPGGIGLSWTVAPDSASVGITLEVRAALARRALVDTVVTAVACR